jgi:hypothetical protein
MLHYQEDEGNFPATVIIYYVTTQYVYAVKENKNKSKFHYEIQNNGTYN